MIGLLVSFCATSGLSCMPPPRRAEHLVGVVEDEVEPPVGMAIERVVRAALIEAVAADHGVVEGEKAKVGVDVET